MTGERMFRGDERDTYEEVLIGVRPIDIRRAALGLLMRTGAPTRIGDVVEVLQRSFGPRIDNRRISDVLRYQARRGRVRRIEHGCYEYVPGSMSPSTAWRCLHWEREREQSRLRRRALASTGLAPDQRPDDAPLDR